MREIKYRGQHHITKKWLYGWLIKLEGDYYIINKETTNNLFDAMNDGKSGNVIEKTIGQFTGLKDKNGKEIYEGDILKSEYHTNIGEVKWFNETSNFNIVNEKEGYYPSVGSINNELEIIGNIYQNPELKEKN